MGEWSDYFEDFPEENPANYVDGRFAPQEAKKLHEIEAKLEEDQRKLNAEVYGLINDSIFKSNQKRRRGQTYTSDKMNF